jgi:carbamoyltransferase
MLFAYPVRAQRAPSIPAVLHQDRTSRIQTVDRNSHPLFHRLLSAFHQRTQVPLVLNTSFNDSEPIVCTPDDALLTFRRAGLDALFLEDRLVTRG